MTQLKVLTVKKGSQTSYTFNRENVSGGVFNDLIGLGHDIYNMVKELKDFDGDKVQKANERIAFFLNLYTLLNNTYENLEEAIREMAKLEWKRIAN